MTLAGVTKALLAAALLVLAGTERCAAAPKVGIRIVSRSSPGDASAAPSGPVPFRAPMVFWQGPFVSSLESLDCVKETPVAINSQAALLDVCHLKNVTFVPKAEAAEEGAAAEATVEATRRKILGIYRGWRIDPITLRYKQMVFDDGDECGDAGARMGFVLEIVSAKNPDTTPRVYGFKQVDACSFSAKLLVHVPVADSKAQSGIHTPGVLDIIDAKETLPHVCGQMKCRYNVISGKIQAVMTEIRQAKEVMTEISVAKTPALANFTLSSSKAILRSSNTVLERSLELLQTLEQLQLTLQNEIEAKQRAREAGDATNSASGDDGDEGNTTKDVSSAATEDGTEPDASLGEDGSEDDAEGQVTEVVHEVVVEAEG